MRREVNPEVYNVGREVYPGVYNEEREVYPGVYNEEKRGTMVGMYTSLYMPGTMVGMYTSLYMPVHLPGYTHHATSALRSCSSKPLGVPVIRPWAQSERKAWVRGNISLP